MPETEVPNRRFEIVHTVITVVEAHNRQAAETLARHQLQTRPVDAGAILEDADIVEVF